MPTVVLKNGEVRDIPDDEIYDFLQENRDLIQNRQSPRKRPPKLEEVTESSITNTK